MPEPVTEAKTLTPIGNRWHHGHGINDTDRAMRTTSATRMPRTRRNKQRTTDQKETDMPVVTIGQGSLIANYGHFENFLRYLYESGASDNDRVVIGPRGTAQTMSKTELKTAKNKTRSFVQWYAKTIAKLPANEWRQISGNIARNIIEVEDPNDTITDEDFDEIWNDMKKAIKDIDSMPLCAVAHRNQDGRPHHIHVLWIQKD